MKRKTSNLRKQGFFVIIMGLNASFAMIENLALYLFEPLGVSPIGSK
jgi:hypothetical protein